MFANRIHKEMAASGYGPIQILIGVIVAILPYVKTQWVNFAGGEIERYAFVLIGVALIVSGYFFTYKHQKPAAAMPIGECNGNKGECQGVSCFEDQKRSQLVNNHRPSMYFPLEFNLINLISHVQGKINSRNPACKQTYSRMLSRWNLFMAKATDSMEGICYPYTQKIISHTTKRQEHLSLQCIPQNGQKQLTTELTQCFSLLK